MKRRILMFVACVAVVVCARAAELTPEQKAFQNSIKTFLREEGFIPTIDEENSLLFKKEGKQYWLDVADASPFYIEFHRKGLGIEDADKDVVLKACNEANRRIKCVKAIMLDKSVSLVIETFCHSAEEFKYTFYTCLKELDRAYDKVMEYYSNNVNEGSSYAPFSFNSASVANVEYDGTIISGYDSTILSYKTKYLKPSITLNVKQAGTYDIYVKMYDASGSLCTGSSSPSGYSFYTSVKMTAGINTYYLSGYGNKTAGYWKAGSYRLEFYYNGTMMGQKSFRVY